MMKKLTILAHSRLVNYAVGALLASLWFAFAERHVVAYATTGQFLFLVFCVSETLQAAFFLLRSMPRAVSLLPIDWFVAFGGTLMPLLFRPGGAELWSGGAVVVLVGVFLQVAALLSLNRSFGIVPAYRNIKTQGLYRVVRHPMYASYLIAFTGYLLMNGSVQNIALYLLSTLFIFWRIKREESYLAEHSSYQTYLKQVHWRLVPFVY